MRNTIEIMVWLKRNGHRQVDIWRGLGYRYNVIVNDTIHGRRNNRRVLKWLAEHGCPVELLDLPDDMKEAA